MTTYRPADGLPGYRVGDDGSVWRRRKDGTWGEKKIRLTKCGAVIDITIDGRSTHLSVASLVLTSFGRRRPPGSHTLHFPDPDPMNNRLENLRWVPKSTAFIGVNPRRGERHPRAKLSDEEVRRLREMAQSGEFYQRELAEIFRISECQVYLIIKGRSRASSPGPIDSPDTERRPWVDRRGERSPRAKLKEGDVYSILGLIESGEYSSREIAELFSVDKSTINNIARGDSWAHLFQSSDDDV